MICLWVSLVSFQPPFPHSIHCCKPRIRGEVQKKKLSYEAAILGDEKSQLSPIRDIFLLANHSAVSANAYRVLSYHPRRPLPPAARRARRPLRRTRPSSNAHLPCTTACVRETLHLCPPRAVHPASPPLLRISRTRPARATPPRAAMSLSCGARSPAAGRVSGRSAGPSGRGGAEGVF